MPGVIRLYRFLNLLSIDVVMGAVISALFFARILHVSLRPAGLGALGISVWIIYTVDHLIDARNIAGTASSPRHRFHQKNFNILSKLLVTALVVDSVLVFFIRKPVFQSGLMLAGAVLLYLMFQRRMKHLKELTVATLYSCGVLLPAVSLYEGAFSIALILLFVHFTLTAFINLLLFSNMEREDDLKDKQNSLFTHGNGNAVLMCVIVLQVLLAGFLLMSDQFRVVEWVLIGMNAVLLLILFSPSSFASEERYRLAGDAVFLFPLFFFIQ